LKEKRKTTFSTAQMVYSYKGESIFLVEWEASAVFLFLLSGKQKARAMAMLFPSRSCNMGQWVKE